ncbi:MAG: hypothetical protein ACP5N0_11655, partial [Methanosarcina sp.]
MKRTEGSRSEITETKLRKRNYGNETQEAKLRKRNSGSEITETKLRKRNYGNEAFRLNRLSHQ